MPDYWDFSERLNFSQGVGLTDEILQHILENVPAATEWRKATTHDDKNGTDYWIFRRHNLPPVSVDLKNREFCPIQKFKSDDACIETCSVYMGIPQPPFTDNYRVKPGWTVDERKRTDLVVYTWPHDPDLFGGPQLRYWILYFPFLCAASLKHWREWARDYGERPTPNRGYTTLNVYPPRPVIAQAIRDFSSGTLGERPFR